MTRSTCRYVKAVASVAVPEVVLLDADDSIPALRMVLARNVASVLALVLGGVIDCLEQLADPIGARLASCLAWAPIPDGVEAFFGEVGLSRKVVTARLRNCGLNGIGIVLDAIRATRACHHLLESLKVAAARLAFFGSDRAMRNVFTPRLNAAPSEVKRISDERDVAAKLIAVARRPAG